MIIGNFSYDAKTGIYTGNVTTFTVDRNPVSIVPVTKSGENGPDYRVIYPHETREAEIGAAWRKSSENGRGYVSVQIDDPALPSPIHAALFLAPDEASAALKWTRQPRAATAEASPAKAKPGRRTRN
jgi:uncharacterized protein (DUF736 family)